MLYCPGRLLDPSSQPRLCLLDNNACILNVIGLYPYCHYFHSVLLITRVSCFQHKVQNIVLEVKISTQCPTQHVIVQSIHLCNTVFWTPFNIFQWKTRSSIKIWCYMKMLNLFANINLWYYRIEKMNAKPEYTARINWTLVNTIKLKSKSNNCFNKYI